MRIDQLNIETSESEDRRLFSLLDGKFALVELEKLVNTIYERRNMVSIQALSETKESFPQADMDTVDIVMLWIRQIIRIRESRDESF